MNEMPSPAAVRRLLLASSVGSIVEWYDFFVFASCAALVFDKAFFPNYAPGHALLLALMVYGVGFLSRPLGGLVFGWAGDRYGRKKALIGSLTLMGAATCAIGLVPSYASIGIWAPLLLVILRITQGFAVGGEVGGALLLVAETLPRERRGYWTAWPQIGGPAGNVASAGMLALLAAVLTNGRFVEWGWRLAFLASALLVGVGLWVRLSVEESPLYQQLQAERTTQPAVARATRTPLRTVFSQQFEAMTTVLFAKAGENAVFYVLTTFLVLYLSRVLHYSREAALLATLLASVVDIIAIFVAGALSDRVGRRPVMMVGLFGAAAWTFALFPLSAQSLTVAIVVTCVGGLLHGIVVGGMSPYFVELFPTSVRYTGFSVAYQFGSVISGSVAPFIGVALLNHFNSSTPVSIYALVMALPGLWCVWQGPETRGKDLSVQEVTT